MTLAPALLCNTFEEFVSQLKKVEPFFNYVHIDIMDGQFVNNTSFQDIKKVNTLNTTLQFELHLMVEHPLEEMKQWGSISNVFRVLCHIEALDSPEECIEFAREKKWQTGLVLNPDTALHRAESYYALIDILQFMTVYPGRQGAPFETKVEKKIKQFTKLSQRPQCAVDGSVNKETIGMLKSWGVEIFNVGSALMKAKDIKQAHEELKKSMGVQNSEH